jgi:hypothetical protein
VIDMQAQAGGPGGATSRASRTHAGSRRSSVERVRAVWDARLRARAARREANDETFRAGFQTEAQLPFRCECTETGCTEIVSVTAEEYSRIRIHGRFLVGPGHAHDDVDLVVGTTEHYAVVRRTPSELYLG